MMLLSAHGRAPPGGRGRRHKLYLVSCKMGADAGDASAEEGEGNGHCSLVAAHPQHTACHAGRADLSNAALIA